MPSPSNGKTAIILASTTGITCVHCVHALSAGREQAMAHDPLDDVYSFVERAYIRLQAGDILIRCLEEDSIAPIQGMVEGLVLAGPQSINVLREILAEAGQRKLQVTDDLYQLFNDFEKSLKSYGVILDNAKRTQGMAQLTPARFLSILREQGIADEKNQIDCLKLLRDSRELIVSLANHVRLLDEIETYLKDWLWGLAYQSARRAVGNRNL
jgi:hypothetical protein